jgi:hypothetical protein
MLPRKIHILVKEDSSVKTDFVNFSGSDCLAARQQMHELLAQLGVQIEQTSFTPKPELLAAQGVQQAVTADHETNQEVQMEG